jgi:hypothetical protein
MIDMSKDQPAIAPFDPLQGFTGRDGALDHIVKSQTIGGAEEQVSEERFAQALGAAVIATWSRLSREDQEQIFECAVMSGHRDERDEALREQLAKFLHAHHERTTERAR